MDISIYDNYTGTGRGFDFSHIDTQYKSCDSIIVIICLKGRATFRVELEDIEISRCSFFAIEPDAAFYISEHSDDFRMDVIRLGKEFLEIADEEHFNIQLKKILKTNKAFSLSERRTRMFHIMHSYLKVLITNEEGTYIKRIIYEYIRLFFYEACHIMSTETPEDTKKKENIITKRFLSSVEKNFREHRKVEYYAEEQGITPKHLAYTIKKTTGKYPSTWIEDHSLLESKKLLSARELTIQDISVDLGFSTPSHFSKFFKQKTGMTPNEFRKIDINKSN